MKIFIVGKKSLVAKNLYFFLKKKFDKKKVQLINYNKLKIKNSSFIIINCSSKKITRNKLRSFYSDRDVKIINKISNKNNQFHYIMLSTSKVYGGRKLIKFEYDNCRPKDLYGKQRLKTEKFIQQKLINKNYTILRLSNILNFDIRIKSYSKTFINKMLNDLRFRGFAEIPSKKIIKDFIDQESVNRIIYNVIKKNITGVFNVSSGIPITGNEIAKNIIFGYKKGIIKKNKLLATDNFVLDPMKLYKIINFKISKKFLISKIIHLGKKLKNV